VTKFPLLQLYRIKPVLVASNLAQKSLCCFGKLFKHVTSNELSLRLTFKIFTLEVYLILEEMRRQIFLGNIHYTEEK
jgi:hypothetical protein